MPGGFPPIPTTSTASGANSDEIASSGGFVFVGAGTSGDPLPSQLHVMLNWFNEPRSRTQEVDR